MVTQSPHHEGPHSYAWILQPWVPALSLSLAKSLIDYHSHVAPKARPREDAHTCSRNRLGEFWGPNFLKHDLEGELNLSGHTSLACGFFNPRERKRNKSRSSEAWVQNRCHLAQVQEWFQIEMARNGQVGERKEITSDKDLKRNPCKWLQLLSHTMSDLVFSGHHVNDSSSRLASLSYSGVKWVPMPQIHVLFLQIYYGKRPGTPHFSITTVDPS